MAVGTAHGHIVGSSVLAGSCIRTVCYGNSEVRSVDDVSLFILELIRMTGYRLVSAVVDFAVRIACDGYIDIPCPDGIEGVPIYVVCRIVLACSELCLCGIGIRAPAKQRVAFSCGTRHREGSIHGKADNILSNDGSAISIECYGCYIQRAILTIYRSDLYYIISICIFLTHGGSVHGKLLAQRKGCPCLFNRPSGKRLAVRSVGNGERCFRYGSVRVAGAGNLLRIPVFIRVHDRDGIGADHLPVGSQFDFRNSSDIAAPVVLAAHIRICRTFAGCITGSIVFAGPSGEQGNLRSIRLTGLSPVRVLRVYLSVEGDPESVGLSFRKGTTVDIQMYRVLLYVPACVDLQVVGRHCFISKIKRYSAARILKPALEGISVMGNSRIARICNLRGVLHRLRCNILLAVQRVHKVNRGSFKVEVDGEVVSGGDITPQIGICQRNTRVSSVRIRCAYILLPSPVIPIMTFCGIMVSLIASIFVCNAEAPCISFIIFCERVVSVCLL